MATMNLESKSSGELSSTESISASSVASNISNISADSTGHNEIHDGVFRSAIDISTESNSEANRHVDDVSSRARNSQGGTSTANDDKSMGRSQRDDLRSLFAEFTIKIEDTQRKIATEFKEELIQVKEVLNPIRASIEEANQKIVAIEQEHITKINANTSKIIETNSKLLNAELQIKQLQQQISDNKSANSHNSFNPALIGRMNNIIVSGVKEVQGEDLHTKIKDIATKLNCELSQFKTRRLGKIKRQQNDEDAITKPRAILVEFSSHWEKRKFYAARTKLKDTDTYSSIFFNEDLDKSQSELFYKGRQAKKQNKIKSIWTYGCQVFFTKLGSEQPILLTSASQLPQLSLRNVSSNTNDNRGLSTTPSQGSIRAIPAGAPPGNLAASGENETAN